MEVAEIGFSACSGSGQGLGSDEVPGVAFELTSVDWSDPSLAGHYFHGTFDTIWTRSDGVIEP